MLFILPFWTVEQVAFFFLIHIIDPVEPSVGKAPSTIKQSVDKTGDTQW
jgi:hypothetical protein